MGKSILAVAAGYGVMMAATIALFFGLSKAAPDKFGAQPREAPGVLLLVLILAVGLAAAAGGGWVTSRLAPKPSDRHVWALAGVVIVMSAVSWVMPSEHTAPGWYQAGLLVVGVSGVFIGGNV